MSNEHKFTNQLPDEQGTQHKLVRWLREAAPYVIQHRHKTFVIMLGSDAIDGANLGNIVHDIALLNSLGVRVVLVHGIRTQLDAKLAQQGTVSTFVNAMRVTDSETLQQVIESCSLVRARLEILLAKGLANSPIHGDAVRVASSNVITAKPAGVIDGTDLQHAGLVRKVDTTAINRLLDMGNLVLLSPMGYSPGGDAFSLTCSDVACEVAVALNADKIIVMCDASALAQQSGQAPRELSLDSAEALAENANPKVAWLSAAVKAVRTGVSRAHLLRHEEDGALLQELFTVDGAGTLLSRKKFETTREASAEDLPAIIEMIAPLEKAGVLVERNRDQLAAELHHFTVMEREGMLVAVAALYPFAKAGEKDVSIGEIACITTHPDYRNAARASELLAIIEARAKRAKIDTLFVLTTQTSHWFIERGFREGDLSELPEQKQALYNYQRQSKVLFKKISGN
ncbi:MAG: amino-acid N-acetyltransferase [Pseudomonadales bacterium]|nr:amino-acid N-acetyltransferase [Pseudomonadales bacterium]